MTDKTPLVSVGIPVYNSERFIRQALDALLAQTYPNLELIISDNGSTDGTGEICLGYAARESRIKYHRNPVNIGVYGNYRRVIALASGKYFLWAAVDDLRPPTAIEECVKALLDHEQAVMAHGIVLVKLVGREDLVKFRNEFRLTAASAAERVRVFTEQIEHNGMLYGVYRLDALRKTVLGNCYGQDYLLCLQMSLLGPVEYVQVPIIICRERKSVPSTNPMYQEAPLTVWNLLHEGGLRRRKCWTVLLMGCYYLARIQDVPLSERVKALAAHLSTFSQRYRRQLGKEIIFQLFEPVAWLSTFPWRFAQH